MFLNMFKYEFRRRCVGSATMSEDGSSTPGPGIPASLAAAWGLREQPTKGPRRGLSLERIVQAAVDVAAREGLPAVSMGRVAKEIGSSPMSLYRYVATKDELYPLMVDVAYGRPEPLPADAAGWREALTHWARGQHDALYANLWVLYIPLAGPPLTPGQLAWMEAGLAALHGTGFSEQEKLSTMLLVSGFVRNEARQIADLTTGAAAAGLSPEQAMRNYGVLLARLIDPERFPFVHTAINSGSLEDEDGMDGEFRFGLERILDGVDALVRARGMA
ncbi:TetR/AcrR family transcriptional regulator [Streptacidiphilus sp. PAMC 29251]